MLLRISLLAGLVAALVAVVQPNAGAARGEAQPFSATAITRGAASLAGDGREAMLAASGLQAGRRLTGSVTLRNGDRATRYAFVGRSVNSRELAKRVRLVITRSSDGARMFVGTLGTVRPLDLGPFAAGASETFTFELTPAPGWQQVPQTVSTRVAWRASAV